MEGNWLKNNKNSIKYWKKYTVFNNTYKLLASRLLSLRHSKPFIENKFTIILVKVTYNFILNQFSKISFIVDTIMTEHSVYININVSYLY